MQVQVPFNTWKGPLCACLGGLLFLGATYGNIPPFVFFGFVFWIVGITVTYYQNEAVTIKFLEVFGFVPAPIWQRERRKVQQERALRILQEFANEMQTLRKALDETQDSALVEGGEIEVRSRVLILRFNFAYFLAWMEGFCIPRKKNYLTH